MKIIMIGSGQAATVLGRKILFSGHEMVQVFSPTKAHAQLLASELSCAYTSQLDDLNAEADLYIAAITDRALPELAQKLRLNHKLIVHTAGSLPMDILKSVSKNYGVLYPLQSLNREVKEIPTLPLLVDGSSGDSVTLISDFAGTISKVVKRAGDVERLKLHLAAVIVNNFSNHLYAMTDDFCKREEVDFSWLLPLISETANRLGQIPPSLAQTGPAIRNDQETIRGHIDMLEKYPELQQLYKILTQSIETSLKSFSEM